ncbi:TPA: hypothetical protein CPT96_00260 [Candidatus Gastranaerophilales bacterium HUM_10]|nr:MAG TPA: hypothetical protein CPT96_00260 [Candidatus Gastranaerophilales bacterium HUM_10]
MNKNYKKVLLIDLDGVLNNYNGKFDANFIPDIKNGAYEFLQKLSKDYEVKIFTTRNRLLAVKWLIKNKIDCFVSDITNIKDAAYLHIDDRAICFEGDYEKTFNEIKEFKVYWKKNT